MAKMIHPREDKNVERNIQGSSNGDGLLF